MIVEIKTVNDISLSVGLKMMILEIRDANHFIFEVDDEDELNSLKQEIEEIVEISNLKIN